MKNNLSIVILFSLLTFSCNDYGYEPPHCIFPGVPAELIPHDFELASEPYLEYRFNGEEYKMIFQEMDGMLSTGCSVVGLQQDSVPYIFQEFQVDQLFQAVFFYPFKQSVLSSLKPMETEIIPVAPDMCVDSLLQFRMGFNLMNSCRRKFFPLRDGNSYHRIVSLELLDQEIIEVHDGDYLFTRYNMVGEFACNFEMLDGTTQRVEGEYRYEPYTSELVQ